MSGLQAHFFVGAGWSVVRTGYGRGVSAWIWKKSAARPSGWRVRKGWKSLMSNGKSASSGSCGCTSTGSRSQRWQSATLLDTWAAKIWTSEPVGEAKFFEGRLAGFADGKVRLELKGKEARTVEVPLEAIRKANLVVEF